MDEITSGVSRQIAVLDTPMTGERRLAETVEGAGLRPVEAHSLDEMVELLQGARALVGLVAFEALLPDAQRNLRQIRERTPGTRLLSAHSEHHPRLRLGQRLWMVGLLDAFIPRSTPPHVLGPLLRQALADALIETAAAEDGLNTVEGPPLIAGLRFLRSISGSFTNQPRSEGLLREVHARLPRLIDYSVLQFLLSGQPNDHRLVVYQTHPVEHEAIWRLAEHLCAASAPFSAEPLTPEQLVFTEHPPLSPHAEVPTAGDEGEPIVLPMVHLGELVGCLGLLPTSPTAVTPEKRALLQVIAYQLATSLATARALEAAEEASLVDELTGAHNRRYLSRTLQAELRRATRYNLPLSVAMVDLDHFKSLNDRHGHLVGDAVLRAVASLLRQHLRDTDHLVRFGGEEFLLVLPETGPSETTLVLERIRLVLRRQPVHVAEGGGHLNVSFSAGVAGIPACRVRDAEGLIELADQALLVAKRSGRDRVCVAHQTGSEAGGVAASGIIGDGTPTEKRRFPRIASQLAVRYVALPDFDGRVLDVSSTDVSAGGIAVRGPDVLLKRHSYALVFLEQDQKPLLSQVVWTRDGDAGERTAGLRFVKSGELEPLAEVPATAVTKERPRVLVVVDHDRTRKMVGRVLSAARFEGVFVSAEEDLAGLDLGSYPIVVVGESALRAPLGKELQRVRAEAGSLGRLVVVNEMMDRRQALRTVQACRLEHLVGSDEAAEEALFATLNKLIAGEYFGLKKYLGWGAEPRSWTVANVDDKDATLAGVVEFARKVGCHPRIADLLVTAVDEMIINALYHPPAGTTTSPVVVELGSDGRLLAVAVLDDHGLFRPEDLFLSLGRALEHEEHGLPETADGHAKLGFRIMLSTLSQLAINVERGRRTEIVGIVDLRKSLREYRMLIPSLGVFTKKT